MLLAEGEGFEPSIRIVVRMPVLQTGAFNLSATPPYFSHITTISFTSLSFYFSILLVYIYCIYLPVAQLDRAAPF